MIRKYENFIKSKEKNIINIEKVGIENKSNNSFNKNILNQNRNKIKSKPKEKNRKNVLKTINILHSNKKQNNDNSNKNLVKNIKKEKVMRLNLCSDLLNIFRNINTNNIKNYKNTSNKNNIGTYNCFRNNNSNEETKKAKRKSIKRNNCHWTKKTKMKKNKKKNLSQISITNLINNKYRINNSSLTKTKSTENINMTKNHYNQSSDNENHFINFILNKMPVKEYNSNYINHNNSKNANLFNNNKQKKYINKNIKINYNIYRSNSKNNTRKNRWSNSPGYKNVYKNSEKIMSSIKNKKYRKTPLSHKRLFNNIYINYRTNKKESFNFNLFNTLCIKTKKVLENCKKTMEMYIENKLFS